ncbi:unnamed protein product [Rhizopus stolonifer]
MTDWSKLPSEIQEKFCAYLQFTKHMSLKAGIVYPKNIYCLIVLKNTDQLDRPNQTLRISNPDYLIQHIISTNRLNFQSVMLLNATARYLPNGIQFKLSRHGPLPNSIWCYISSILCRWDKLKSYLGVSVISPIMPSPTVMTELDPKALHATK